MKRSALLVIDMQTAAFEPEVAPAMHEADKLLKRVAGLIGAARSAETPVVFVQHCEPEGRPLAEGSLGWAIHPALAHMSDSTVLKHESSAFAGTNLHELLEEMGVDTIIACGIQSEFCVANTCVSAMELGMTVHVARDAHSTRSTNEVDASVIIDRQNARLARRGAIVGTTAALVKRLNGGSLN